MLSSLYQPVLMVHGIFRWIVLAAAVAAVVVSLSGWLGKKPWSVNARRAGLIFVGMMDLQFLIGLVLYAASPVIKTAWQDMKVAMKDHDLRFFAVEHTAVMLLALILAHVGSVLSKKASTDAAKYRLAAIWYGISLLLILSRIPWFRPLFRGF